MNKLSTVSIFAAALMFAGVASAQTAAPAKTRAEVIAELQAARASGELAEMHAEVGVNGYRKEAPTALAAKSGKAVTAEKKADKKADPVVTGQ